MAGEVFRCLKDNKGLLIEAGTGVGKSFAYLIPAILSREKTVVSTSSLALQDQLVKKDLVFLLKVLPRQFSFGVLKGKNNYLCLKREREFTGSDKSYLKFQKWLSNTKTGEKSELSFIPEFWSKVSGDPQDCNGRMCPNYDNCFYSRHYRSLFKKDILVINHHLLIYDLLSDFNILPFHENLIIDEAADIENVISSVLGSRLSHSRVTWLLYRLRGLKITVNLLLSRVELFFKKMNAVTAPPCPIPDSVPEELKELKKVLGLSGIVAVLTKYSRSTSDSELSDRIETTINYVHTLAVDIDDFIEQDDPNRVYYLAKNNGNLELKSSLVESQDAFKGLTVNYKSTIMTSATLTSGENFNFLKKRLGIDNFEEKIIGSPFDYKKQLLLYIDQSLPEPVKTNERVFQEESLHAIEDLIKFSRGRALVLFTSYQHLNFVANNTTISYPFRSQGGMPPAKLIQWFKDTPNSVLLATVTFWQGIDIKGDDLSLVIIVKLPFSSPGDPVYRERCKKLKNRWFQDLALPSAILMLRQGFGRLIRGRNEYGVVAMLDTRISKSSYGSTIISSLPKTNITHCIEDVQSFFDSLPGETEQNRTREKPPPVSPALEKDLKNAGDAGKVVALGNSNDPAGITEIIKFTKSSNGNERRLAASALEKLARFKPDILRAVSSLEGLLKDEKPQVRQCALNALLKIGVANRDILDFIVSDPDKKKYNISVAKKLLKKIK